MQHAANAIDRIHTVSQNDRPSFLQRASGGASSESILFPWLVEKTTGVDLQRLLLLQKSQVFFDMLRENVNHVLSPPVLKKIQSRQDVDDIFRLDTGLFGDLFDRHHAFLLTNDLQDLLRPVATIADLAQIRQRPLRCARFAFEFRKLVGEADQETTVATALIGW